MTEPQTEPVLEPAGEPWYGPAMRLSRRVKALIVGGLLFAVLFVLVLTLHVPFVILSPGPTFNVLGDDGQKHDIISISGTTTKNTTGHLNMTTVNVTNHPITAFEALIGWLKSDQIVVPHSAIYPPGQTEEQVNKQNSADFASSQNSAIAAAACQLGYPHKTGITQVLDNGPSGKVLKPGDVITSVGGTPTPTLDALTKTLQGLKAGSSVAVAYQRAGHAGTGTVTLGAPLQGRTGGSLGIQLGDLCQLPFEVDLGLGDTIGGPSAGMMFALGIIDKVGKEDLTDGRFIAGTGTIDASGKVGPIGGIQLKMIAARDAGATVFLAPAGNCTDVVGNVPDGLKVVKVDTLAHAVQYLDDTEQGKPVPSC